MRVCVRFFAIALLLFTSSVFAQGVQTATLEGRVTTSDGTGLPGVTVTVTSPALQGTRTAVTESAGNYILPGLPPGNYTIHFALEGMQAVDVNKTLSLGLTNRADAQLKVSAVTE